MNEGTLTRWAIAEALQQGLRLKRVESLRLVDSIICVMRDGLAEDGILKISNFGTFKVREKNERPGRNPRTGELHIISARKSLHFSASKGLRQRVA